VGAGLQDYWFWAIIFGKTRLYRLKETVAKSELLFREMPALTKHHLH
jgi:hypothetical protein